MPKSQALCTTTCDSRPGVWIVGGSGKLGLCIADLLAPSYDVTSFSRTRARDNSEYYRSLKVDLADLSQVNVIVDKQMNERPPRAIIFCQRYRQSSNNQAVGYEASMNVEILSSQIMIEAVIGREEAQRCSFVVISSVNGYLIDRKLPFWYHWLKSSQIQLVKYYSVKNGNCAMNINCIAPGSFLKGPVSVYPESVKDHLEVLCTSSPMGRNADIDDIADTVEFLISDRALMINGQVITLDSGLTNILQEAMLRL